MFTVRGLAGVARAFFNSLWTIYGLWRSRKR